MHTRSFVELAGDGASVMLSTGLGTGLKASDAGIDGWYSSPQSKVKMTERSSGDGAHSIVDEAILYAARVVSVGIHAIGENRDDVLGLIEQVNGLLHQNVRIRVADSEQDTFATGYLTVEWDNGVRRESGTSGSVTVVCSDPRRYSTEARTANLTPNAYVPGGLLYDETDGYLLSPVQFYGEAPSNVSATIENEGSSTAYPVITASGSFPNGIRLTGDWGELNYPVPIGNGAPLVIDCLTRTASVLGQDVTRSLTHRDFPSIQPGDSVSMTLASQGTGTVTVESRDTYI